jgi:DNA polymerase-1
MLPFREIFVVDFEFTAKPGERPDIHCLVAREVRSGRLIRLWKDEFGSRPPYPVDDDVLFVAFFASADLGCHKALGWPMPKRVLDPFTEFRLRTNGLTTPAGNGLIGALTYFGLDHMNVAEKQDMRNLAIRGGPFTDQEKADLLGYCQEDVDATVALLKAMLPSIDLPRAIGLRGRYMRAVAAMEHNGVPVDLAALDRLRANWEHIQDTLIADMDSAYRVFEGRVFKRCRFEALLVRLGIPWPLLESGSLDLSDDTFRSMSKAHPIIEPLHELRFSLSKLRLSDLSVGHDGRNRTLLSPFRARTGRNQPSNSKFIFGPAVWLRGLIRPEPGYGLAYVDWSQQEFGIAAALSQDPVMQKAYLSGDPYLEFAKLAHAVPEDATRATHEDIRELFKQCVLGVQYGMGEQTLAVRAKTSNLTARELLRAHRRTFRTFWEWSDAALDHAMLHNFLQAAMGWTIHVGVDANPRSLRNFPMQAGGAEMLRLACCFATERGVEVCAPVHDALLVHAPLDRLEDDIRTTQAAMAEASRIVLKGFELSTEVQRVRYPDHYMDQKRGRKMWDKVWTHIDQIERRAAA